MIYRAGNVAQPDRSGSGSAQCRRTIVSRVDNPQAFGNLSASEIVKKILSSGA